MEQTPTLPELQPQAEPGQRFGVFSEQTASSRLLKNVSALSGHRVLFACIPEGRTPFSTSR